MKEINRYSVPNSDVWLVHVQNEDGSEDVWAVLDLEPERKCDPALLQGSFFVAQSEDRFSGLESLAKALLYCASAIKGEVAS